MAVKHGWNVAEVVSGLLFTGAAVLLRALLDPLLGDHRPLATIYAAVVIAVWVGGWRPALVVSVAGFMSAQYFFIQPRYAISVNSWTDVAELAIFAATCAIIIGFGAGMRSAQIRAENEALEALSKQKQLAIEIHERQKVQEELLRQSEALRQSEEKFRRIVETANEGICVLDTETRITLANQRMADLLGYRLEEMLGQPKDCFVFVEDRPRMIELFERRRAGISEQADVRFRHKSGREVWMLLAARPLYDSAGHFQGALDLFTDVTERKQLERELQERANQLAEADVRKDHFLAVLAHELRNPLAPIQHGLTLLAAEADPHAPDETLQIMQQQVDQLIRLVDDLLDISRIATGKINLRKQPVELQVIFDRAVETVKPLIEQLHHRFHLSVPPTPIWIEGDEVRLSQVISNLLNNAAKYTKPGGEIWLSGRCDGGCATLEVRDTGMGIEPEVLPHVFELFTQSDRTFARAQGGLGIGLSLARSLVQMHGDKISASSAGSGKGSEFTIELPVTTQLPESTSPQRPQTNGRKLRILLVEDSPGTAKLLSRMLVKFWGHDVEVAPDGQTALAAVDRFRPELVLSDINLPGMNGYTVAEKIREQPGYDRLLLVALTGNSQQTDRCRAKEAGFDDFLVKPISVTDLEKLFTHPKLQ